MRILRTILRANLFEPADPAAPMLTLDGFVVFGGVEVRA
jgi:hypothetical protein